ncbi:xanthine dehydrogenase [Cavenderia fasciculata]|uniref:xanthine dehydrogenase n=1 Tax=Cavenderia fasciculata TaxID=261658 RepID=F4PRC7_CACFS|nr:xanthine dehydrogenase [Cavenderia fasciculata]EGG20479.1 xanthine dehydrogenase [Cavenderia fasciculata]|eukprot:XP_004358329.1 xanthine dehydrogenase [Cavenderia fasciculata]
MISSISSSSSTINTSTENNNNNINNNNYNHDLLFYLNGNKVVVRNPNPEHTLLHYLRSLNVGLTGTKLGCGEGGCGACTVMISHYSSNQDKIIHRAINACLFPLCAVSGCAITTIEGLGNVTDGLHPVQSRISEAYGSQCGFCTPGIIMALYSYLRSHPTATQHDIEECFDGNLCRCTGYRPILDAAKSFGLPSTNSLPSIASGIDTETPEKQNICPSSGKPCDCKSNTQHIPSKPLDLKQELIFPPYLVNYKQETTLKFDGDRAIWYTPTTFDELLQLKSQYNHAKIVVGNTEIGIETKFRNVVYPVLLSPVRVQEMNGIRKADDGIHIGASVTLTEIRSYLQGLCNDKQLVDQNKTQTYRAMLTQFKWFAGNQIRNAACLGGNIVTASPISDINPVLLAAGAILELVSIDKNTGEKLVRHVNIRTFFKTYRVVDILPSEVLSSIFVPFTNQLEYVEAYKQSRRREDDIAIVSCCFRVQLERSNQTTATGEYSIKDISLAYGGMNVKAVLATKTMDALVGKIWSQSLLDEIYSNLEIDLPLAEGAPGGMIEYRRSLTTSFFFKFFLTVNNYLFVDSQGNTKYQVDEREKSATNPYHREMTSGEQTYQTQPLLHPVTQPIKHQSSDKQVTGEAIYVDDMKQSSLYAAMVLSTKAHANITSIDASKALSLPGVKGFYTHKDIRGSNMTGPVFYDEELLASKTVLCQGYPIGVIVAETHQQALEASKAVQIQYEELTPVLTIEDAIEKNSFLDMVHTIKNGREVDQVFGECENVVQGEFKMGGQEHFYLETNVSLAVPIEGDEYHIYSSTQNPTKTQILVAKALGVSMNQIVVKTKRMGGGFGGKESRSIFVSCIASLAAQKLRQPVRLVLDRDTDMITTGTRHPFLGRYKIGFDNEGMIKVADIQLFADAGYSYDLSGGVLDRAIFHSENAYKVPNIRVVGRLCKTNLPTNTAFRGFGGPQGMMVCENWIEQISHHLQIPSYKIRERNFYKEGELTHYLQEVSNCHLDRIWKETLQKSNYLARLEQVKQFNEKNKWKKRGIALIPTKFGMSFTIKTLNQAGALVHIYTDGSVLVTHGGTEMGQGLHTKIIQIAAKELGVPVEKVYVSETSTDKVANTAPTAASVSSDMNGMATLDACKQINQRLEPLRQRFPNYSFAQLTTQAFVERINLSANGYYATPNVGYLFKDGGVGEGTPFNYFNYGCSVSEVEIDTLTGDHTILQSDIIMDVGDSLNPTIDIGQVEGAFIQGVGLTTLEEVVTFKPSGYQFTRGPSTYKIPGFNDIPIIFNVSLFGDAPNPKAIHSSKGVGEPPLFLGSSVFFAIREAIIASRQEQKLVDNNGNNVVAEFLHLESPATCERIRNACIDRFTKQFTK